MLADMEMDRGIEKVELWDRAATSHTGVDKTRQN